MGKGKSVVGTTYGPSNLEECKIWYSNDSWGNRIKKNACLVAKYGKIKCYNDELNHRII